MRRRRCLAVTTATVLIGGVGFAACDTDDGREMQPPTSYQEWRLAQTTTSTTTTVAPVTLAPTTTITIAPVVESSEPALNPSSTPSTAPGDSTGSLPGEVSANAALVGSAPSSSAAGSAAGAQTGVIDFEAPWESGQPIDVAYTCDGDGQVPLLTWTAPPAGTVELALVVTDDDTPNDFVHWIVIGLPAEAGSLGGAEPVVVGTEGSNSGGTVGWTGPCPPAGPAHTYRFTLYLLDQQLEMPADTPPAELVAAVQAAAADEATLTGTYERAG